MLELRSHGGLATFLCVSPVLHRGIIPNGLARSLAGSFLLADSGQVAVRVVPDFTEYPHNYLPQTIQRAAEIVGLDREGRIENHAWDKLVSHKRRDATSHRRIPYSTSFWLEATIEMKERMITGVANGAPTGT